MRTFVFTNGSLDAQPTPVTTDWGTFDLGYGMMFDDGQNDPIASFGTEDKTDDVHPYSSYLHDDLQPAPSPESPVLPDNDVDHFLPVKLDQPLEPPESPIVPEMLDKPSNKKAPAIVDPHAEAFLQESLGPEKWTTFCARLFERRLTGPRGKSKKASPVPSGPDGANETSATVIDFLCKAEAVKEVLRVYVPHPYNPSKTLSHNFTKAPSGRVTLSRSTVLALSGWSNTQFSYWARRSEAIAVLAPHDSRLKMVANAFSRRLSGNKIPDEVAAVEGVTGKGLDFIIDEVKERTGASPFIHGKHSSLDPFSVAESVLDGPATNTTPSWTDFATLQPSSSGYAPTSFMADGAGSTDASQAAEAVYFALGSGHIAPSSLSPISPTAPSGPKRGRPPSGNRAKRGSKQLNVAHTSKEGKSSNSKRKASGDSDTPPTGRKRAKTNVSTDES